MGDGEQSNIARRRAEALRSGDDRYHERRRALIAAAAKVFRERGYRATSINDIAQELDMDRATIYYYTSGKKELFQAVIGDVAELNCRRVEAIRDSALSPTEKIRETCVELMRSYAEHHPYFYVYLQEDMTTVASGRTAWDRRMKRMGKRYADAMTAILRAGEATGEFSFDVPARVAAFGILGMVNWTHRWFEPTGEVASEDLGRAYGSIILDGIRSPGTAG